MQLPNEADRTDIFQIHTRSIPYGPDVDLKELARLTEGYTGADIKLVCREAAVAALDVCSSSFPALGDTSVCIFTTSSWSLLINYPVLIQ